ncbi:MAG: DegV family protein [Bacillota bacterium]
MNIKIITDSVSDIPKNLIKKYNIEVLPLTVTFKDKVYNDGIDLKTDEFFEKLSKSEKLPKTSQVTPGRFLESFKKNIKKYDKIICITMSKKMSGTYQAALTAKKMLGDRSEDIDVFDSKAISFGYGLVVLKAALDIEKNIEYKKIKENIKYNINNLENLFIVDTLKYLKKGGRLSVTKAFIGKMLKLKPIVTINDGRLEVTGKARGRKRAIKWFINYLDDNNINLDNKTIGLFHAVDKKYLHLLEKKLKEKYNNLNIYYSEVGAVVGTHSGPGCIALVFIK